MFDLENANTESYLQVEFIDICVDLEDKWLFKSKKPSDYWSKCNY